MEVRIRSTAMTRPVVIADIPFRPDVIDKVIPSLQAWGVFNGEGTEFPAESIVGQFVVDEDREVAYFEVTVGVED